jgi:hypothetical protein
MLCGQEASRSIWVTVFRYLIVERPVNDLRYGKECKKREDETSD